MSRKSKLKKSSDHVKWRPVEVAGRIFVPSSPPIVIESDGSERVLTTAEAKRRFPALDFGFPRPKKRR